VTLQTVEAALNEVLEHAQVEFFHGRPHNLDPSRRKRLDSLAKTGHQPARYEFASSAEVVAKAKQAAVAAHRKLAAETDNVQISKKTFGGVPPSKTDQQLTPSSDEPWTAATLTPSPTAANKAKPVPAGYLGSSKGQAKPAAAGYVGDAETAAKPSAAGSLGATQAALMASRTQEALAQALPDSWRRATSQDLDDVTVNVNEDEYRNATGPSVLTAGDFLNGCTSDSFSISVVAVWNSNVDAAPGPWMDAHNVGWHTIVYNEDGRPKVDGNGNYERKLALRTNNRYLVRWSGGPPQDGQIKIYLVEYDGYYGEDAVCANTDTVLSRQWDAGDLDHSPNSFMFAMPDLANSECATSDYGFPEFQIVIRAEGGDRHVGRWPNAQDTFVQIESFEVSSSGKIVVTGGCHTALDNDEYDVVGYTASGAPYYRDLFVVLHLLGPFLRWQCGRCGLDSGYSRAKHHRFQ